jgi:hypothetical protein
MAKGRAGKQERPEREQRALARAFAEAAKRKIERATVEQTDEHEHPRESPSQRS